jgi:hypothetical protein
MNTERSVRESVLFRKQLSGKSLCQAQDLMRWVLQLGWEIPINESSKMESMALENRRGSYMHVEIWRTGEWSNTMNWKFTQDVKTLGGMSTVTHSGTFEG